MCWALYVHPRAKRKLTQKSTESIQIVASVVSFPNIFSFRQNFVTGFYEFASEI